MNEAVLFVEHGAFDHPPRDRVGPVEYIESRCRAWRPLPSRRPSLSRRCRSVRRCLGCRKTNASRPSSIFSRSGGVWSFAIQTVHRHAGRPSSVVSGNIGLVTRAVESVLGGKNGLELHIRRFSEQIDIAPPPVVDTGVVSNQPDPHAVQGFEIVSHHHVEPGQDRHSPRGSVSGGEGRAATVTCSVRDAKRVRVPIFNRPGHYIRHVAAQIHDRCLDNRVDTVRQQNDVSLRYGVDPHRRPGISRMPIRSGGKQIAASRRVGGVNIPAQPAKSRMSGRALGRGHLCERQRTKHAGIA